MTQDYKSTLNLPTTKFPMKANLPHKELHRLIYWEDIRLYRSLRKHCAGRPRYILHDGPPYANGFIHLGHAVNKGLKDMVLKSKTLSGFDAPFLPGWDCHGLPIELNVEKKRGKPGIDITPQGFRKACYEYARMEVIRQREDFTRLGGLGDWYRPYLTLDNTYEANIIRALAEIAANGHLYRGYKPVHWCVDCGSALAEAEVEYKNKVSPAIDVCFFLTDPQSFWQRVKKVETTALKNPALAIWTTTPWTLPANEAIALHADVNYVVIQVEQRCLVMAEARVADRMAHYGYDDYRIIGTCTGKDLADLKCHHPFYDKVVPIVLGEHVNLDSGTGAVHTAPGHGVDDYHLGLAHNLPIEHPVGPNGCFIDNTPLFAGKHIFKVNESVIAVLKERDCLLQETTLEHSYPHCWRHKTPLIFRATPQWFISMDKQNLRAQALEAIAQIKWIPEWGQKRMTEMVANRPDWCISRQRYWGVPLPLFFHQETGELHPDTVNLLKRAADLVEESGIEAWFSLDKKQWLGDEAKDYCKVMDVLDVWFDSGVSHYCVLNNHPHLQYPADMYLEGSDQHRGWFQSSLLTAIAAGRGAPYKSVLTHGYTVDGQGHKMSKSLGNVISPDKIFSNYGADVLRLWIASTDYRSEINISEEILDRTADIYRRIRNTARYCLANLTEFKWEESHLPTNELLALDQWIIHRTYQIQQEITKAYETFQFHQIVKTIHHFCSITLGSFYLDIIKDRQYTMPKHSHGYRSVQTALYHIIQAMVRWLAPILSFTAEEIWCALPNKPYPSVLFTTWYDKLTPLTDQALLTEAQWQKVINVREVVNSILEKKREEGKIGSSLDAEITLYCDPNWYELLKPIEKELHFILITSSAKLVLEQSSTAIATACEGLSLDCEPSTFTKCTRCWHHHSSVGENSSHPLLCERCVLNIEGAGENRTIA